MTNNVTAHSFRADGKIGSSNPINRSIVNPHRKTPVAGGKVVPPGVSSKGTGPAGIPATVYQNPYSVAARGEYDSDLADLFFGSRGEVKIEELESDKDFCLGMFSDGVWESRRNDIGLFSYLKHPFQVPYLSKPGYKVFELALPKIPYGIILGISEFYKKIMGSHAGAEAMVQIWWNRKKEEYFTYVPVQKVGAASVRFDHSEELQNDSNVIWVMDTHSHNTMNAFFSGGDNADEKSTRIFGVLGKLNTDNWESKWRAGCNGQYVDLSMEDILDMDAAEVVDIDDLETLKVTKSVYGGYYQGKPTNARGNHHQPGTPYRGGIAYHGQYHVAGWQDDYDDYVTGPGLTPQNALDLPEVEDMDLALENIVLGFEGLNLMSDSGMLEVAEMSMQSRRVIDYISDYDEFSPVVAQAIMDQLSLKLKDHDWKKVMEAYKDD